MGNFSILLVDDDKTVSQALKRVFHRSKYEISTALNGEEGMSKFISTRPDLVILDLRMPGKSGMEVLKEMRKENKEANIIIITGYGGVKEAIEAMKAGASDFLQKPIKAGELRARVESMKKLTDLKAENRRLKKNIKDKSSLNRLIGSSPAMQKIIQLSRRLAKNDAAILILGESGTGKGLLAKAIHNDDRYVGMPFVPIDCSAIKIEKLPIRSSHFEKVPFTLLSI